MSHIIISGDSWRWLGWPARACISACLLVLVFGIAVSLPSTVPELLGPFDAQDLATSIAAVAVSILALLAIGSAVTVGYRNTPLPPGRFLIALTAASIAVRMLLAAHVDPVWGGDYLRYWDRALSLAGHESLSINSFYEQRALPVFYPLVSVFGNSALALKTANALALTAVQLMGYDILRKCRSHQAAQGFGILFLFAPVPAYEALIPSHNLWGLFFTCLALWLIARACYLSRGTRRYWFKVCLYGLATTIAIELLELQRGTSLLFTMSVGLSALLICVTAIGLPREGRESAGALLIIAAICTVLYMPIAATSTALGLRIAQTSQFEATTYMKLAAHGGTMGNGQSDSWARFDERFQDKHHQGTGAARDFARSIILSSWVDPDESKIRLIHSLAPRLFDLGYPTDWNVALKSPRGISPPILKALIYYADCYGFFLSLLFLVALVRAGAAYAAPPAPILIGLILTSATAAALLVVFENKAPNLFSIWLAAPFVVALTNSRTGSQANPESFKLGQIVSGGALILLSLIAVRLGISAFFNDEDGRILRGWSVDDSAAEVSTDSKPTGVRAPHTLAFNARYYEKGALKPWVIREAATDSSRLSEFAANEFTVLELPAPPRKGDRVSMSKRVCVDSASRGTLEFFLFSSYQRNLRTPPFVVDVLVDGKSVKRISVPFNGRTMRLFQAAVFTEPACRELTIALTSNVTRTAESWRRASHVEVWLPRLVDSEAAKPGR